MMETPRELATMIVPGLFLGNSTDGKVWMERHPFDRAYPCLAVRENARPYAGSFSLPFHKRSNGEENEAGGEMHEDLLLLAIETLGLLHRTAVQRGGSVLVHCTGGHDRAPYLVARYLMRRDSITLKEAYSIVRAHRPSVREHLEWGP